MAALIVLCGCIDCVMEQAVILKVDWSEYVVYNDVIISHRSHGKGQLVPRSIDSKPHWSNIRVRIWVRLGLFWTDEPSEKPTVIVLIKYLPSLFPSRSRPRACML